MYLYGGIAVVIVLGYMAFKKGWLKPVLAIFKKKTV